MTQKKPNEISREQVSVLVDLIEKENLGALDALLSQNSVRYNIRHQVSALVVAACQTGSVAILDYLLNCPHYDNSPPGIDRPSMNRNAFERACQSNRVDIVRYCMETLSKPEQVNKDHILKGMYSHALNSNSIEVIQYIISRPEITPFIDFSHSQNQCLHICVRSCAKRSLEFLLKPEKFLSPDIVKQVTWPNLNDNRAKLQLIESACYSKQKEPLLTLFELGVVVYENNISFCINTAAKELNISLLEHLLTKKPYRAPYIKLAPIELPALVVLAFEKNCLPLLEVILNYPHHKVLKSDKFYNFLMEQKNENPSRAALFVCIEKAKLKLDIAPVSNEATHDSAKSKFKI